MPIYTLDPTITAYLEEQELISLLYAALEE